VDRRQGLAAVRAVVAVIVLAAIAYQVWLIVDSGLFRPLRFFAFFTILSNLFGAVLWLWLAARWRQPRTRNDDLLRGAATLYLVVTFVVVVVLLRGAELSLSDPTVDFVVHKLFPVLAVVDWIVDPPRTDLRYRDVAMWLVFPLVWVVLTLARGALDNWYPYPFLDHREAHGYPGVVLSIAGITAFFLLLFALARWLDQRARAAPEAWDPYRGGVARP